MSIFIGREEEQRIFRVALTSSESEMIAVFGRRRIGKTYLVRHLYQQDIFFEMTGIQNESQHNQLKNFTNKLQEAVLSPLPIGVPTNWPDAFLLLKEAIRSSKGKKKRVIFFDELPWITTPKSGFLEALAHFWNDWMVKQNMVLVLCGSATSWMIDKVIAQKGGLYNRVTRQIHLQPFTLREAQSFLKSRNVHLNHYQITHLYMAIGGVAHYLKQAEPGQSAARIINTTCLAKNGVLRNEFDNLYAALFTNHERHVKIIRALSRKWKGLTRNEIIDLSKINNGGGLTGILRDLELSSFITSYQPFGKKKRETLHRLTDEYSLFYLKFIEAGKSKPTVNWEQLSQKQSYVSWSSFAFESLCLKHVDSILQVMGISGIHTETYSFAYMGSSEEPGVQIDLLIDRADNCVNLCEMKFYSSEFSISSEYAQKLRTKRRIFQEVSKTKKHVFITLVTTYGLIKNTHSIGLVDNDFNMNVFFNKK